METILVVDDTKSNIQILMELLDNRYDVIACKDGETAIEIAQEDKPDLILLDIMMPDMDGFEVCEKLKELPQTKDIPIIFLTAMTQDDNIEKAYDIGGSDYITKPFRSKELLARVKRELELIRLQNELKLLTLTDSMTKLYNRRYFDEIFPQVIKSAKRKDELVSFVIMDIDHFKQYNDTYGHQMGDDALTKVATSLKETLHRADDYCFRLGGEEFGVVFKVDNKDKAFEFANNIRENIENLCIEHNGNSASPYVTVSMGLVCKNAHNIKDENEVYKQGDDLLYEAKESGRNKVVS